LNSGPVPFEPLWPGYTCICFLCSWDDRHVPPCPAFYWLKWGLAVFRAGLKPQSSQSLLPSS
jgi:hypothetical protein